MSTLIPSSISEQLGMGATGMDGRVLLFTLAVSALAGVLAGIAPAFASANAAQALKDGGRSSSADGRASHRRNAFVVAQTGLAVGAAGRGRSHAAELSAPAAPSWIRSVSNLLTVEFARPWRPTRRVHHARSCSAA